MFMMHAFWKVQDPMAKMSERVNFTKNMALLGAALILLEQSVALDSELILTVETTVTTE